LRVQKLQIQPFDCTDVLQQSRITGMC